MRNKKLIFIFLIFSSSNAASAAPSPIPCPPIIAEKSSGRLYTTELPPSKVAFECYRRKGEAKKNGYKTQKAAANLDFTGWFRIRLAKMRDRCNSKTDDTGPVLFLQVNQKENAVFGDFCPSLGQMTGARTGSSLTMSRTTTLVEPDGPLSCSDNLIARTDLLVLSPVVDNNASFNAVYEVVRRCVNDDDASKSCSIQYSGPAFYETHKIWPKVDANINMIKPSCKTALHSCVDCHPNLAGIDLEP